MEEIQITDPGKIVKPEDEINKEHEMAIMAGETMLEHAIRCGELLIAQKTQLDHGDFIPWIQEHCHFDRSQAWRYMKVAESTNVASLQHLKEDSNPENLPNLGGVTSIAQALRQITAANPPAPKEQKIEVPKEIVFSWFHDPEVSATLAAMPTFRAGVTKLIADKRDPAVRFSILNDLLELMNDISGTITDNLHREFGV